MKVSDAERSAARWSRALPELEQSWAAAAGQSTADAVERWQQAWPEVAGQYEQLREGARWSAGPADLLSVLGRQRRETYHCALLAWLMDPVAPHGFGTRFLSGALRRAGLRRESEDEALASAVTYTEVRRQRRVGELRLDRRADIVVRASGLCLVIEAKVDHWESEDQCQHTWELWRHEPGARFIFLTPRGHAPHSARGEARSAFRRLSFRDLRSELSGLLGETRAGEGPGLATARTYLHTLTQEFP